MTSFTFKFQVRKNEPTLVVILADDYERAHLAASSVGRGRKQLRVIEKPINGTTIGVPVIILKAVGGKPV